MLTTTGWSGLGTAGLSSVRLTEIGGAEVFITATLGKTPVKRGDRRRELVSPAVPTWLVLVNRLYASRVV